MYTHYPITSFKISLGGNRNRPINKKSGHRGNMTSGNVNRIMGNRTFFSLWVSGSRETAVTALQSHTLIQRSVCVCVCSDSYIVSPLPQLFFYCSSDAFGGSESLLTAQAGALNPFPRPAALPTHTLTRFTKRLSDIFLKAWCAKIDSDGNSEKSGISGQKWRVQYSNKHKYIL